jgi:hypothetical protein
MAKVGRNTRLVLTLEFCSIATLVCELTQADESTPDESSHELLSRNIDRAWKTSWFWFYRGDTRLFYDYLTSYAPGRELDHLPTADEVNRQYPNECGCGTGLEDCMLSVGVMLAMIVDRYAVSKEEMLRERVDEVF